MTRSWGGLKAVIEFYYGPELDEHTRYQLKVPQGLSAQAELRALRPQSGGFKLARKLIAQELIDNATWLFSDVNLVTIDILPLPRTCYRRETTFSMS
jgi:hypothetical protein